MRDTGILKLCDLVNTADRGQMPVNRLVPFATAYYSERSVSFQRVYQAMGAQKRIDALVRCWNTLPPENGKYAVLKDGKQYRIAMVQKIVDMDAVDLTLERLETDYDVMDG